MDTREYAPLLNVILNAVRELKNNATEVQIELDHNIGLTLINDTYNNNIHGKWLGERFLAKVMKVMRFSQVN